MILFDNDNQLDTHSAELLALAEAMRQAADDAEPRELFYAAAVLMSFALARQDRETRNVAIDTALEIIQDGQRVFGENKPPRFDA
jgi:hypothetical protein